MRLIRLQKNNKAIVYIRLRPRCAIPHSRPIILIQRLQSSFCPVVCTPLHAPVQLTIHKGVRLVGHVFPKIALSLWGSSRSCNTLFLGSSPLITPNGISIGSAVFVWVPNANALSMGKKTPKNCPFPLRFRYPAGWGPSHSHRQHAQKIGKDRACGSRDILADRQTDIHTDVLITTLSNRFCGRSNLMYLVFLISSCTTLVHGATYKN